MGNLMACGLISPFRPPSVVKIVHKNGFVEEFPQVIAAKELTVDYPDHFVYTHDLISFPDPLSDDSDLQLGHLYFLLPDLNTFTDETLRSLAAIATHSANLPEILSPTYTTPTATPPLTPPPPNTTRTITTPTPIPNSNPSSSTTNPPIATTTSTPSGGRVVGISKELVAKMLVEVQMEMQMRQQKKKPGLLSMSQSCKSWRPKLETIEESNFVSPW